MVAVGLLRALRVGHIGPHRLDRVARVTADIKRAALGTAAVAQRVDNVPHHTAVGVLAEVLVHCSRLARADSRNLDSLRAALLLLGRRLLLLIVLVKVVDGALGRRALDTCRGTVASSRLASIPDRVGK